MNGDGHKKVESIQKLTVRESLAIHLTHNFYPPIHTTFVISAEEAISEARKGNWEKEITLPNKKVLTVDQIISELRLEQYLEED